MNSNKIKQIVKNSGDINEHFDPVSVRGIVSRVQTALPSIRIRLRNLRPGFHSIYQKKRGKSVSIVTLLGKHAAGYD